MNQKPTEPVAEGLTTTADKLHATIATFLKDWRDGDFILPRLAEIHIANIEEKYLAVGRSLLAQEESFKSFQKLLNDHVNDPPSNE